VRGLADGKAVWFTLDRPDVSSPDAEVYSIVRPGAGEDAEDDGADDAQDVPERSMQARAVN
jgi:hypothetical protein